MTLLDFRLTGLSTHGEQLMGYMDTNGDHIISKDEASEELKPNFQYLDTNGDGFLDMRETEVIADYFT